MGINLGKIIFIEGRTAKRIHTKSNRGSNDSHAVFRYLNTDAPGYRKSYCDAPYSEKQRRILSREIPLDQIRMNELTKILTKAIAQDDADTEKKVRQMKYEKMNPERAHLPHRTKEDIIARMNERDEAWRTWLTEFYEENPED